MPVLIAIVVLIAAELAVLIEVAKAIGTAPAVLALLIISASGPWLVRRAGFGVWRRARERLDGGELPGTELLDGVVTLAGGVLVCIPGFITDVIGLALLAPPVRALARRVVARRMARRTAQFTATVVSSADGVPPRRSTWTPSPGDEILDVGSHPSLPPEDPDARPRR